ncbi:enoyl-ACP reductase [Pseudoalteromonas luteoviolacea]|uniref:Enoyl-[acyl-carrier-protein] reductase [NADH] n=1 Tax=Pseudoalteromonas luteoviolacea TaxID=43657 RepID=A0A1C0TQH0_9GAMM|nr:SDR family oxidoreductase [Pseudoalteromonas luteoviolacea]OCQ21207.1 enoyl-ACP reductase [Pseudoalteromonas luteoviolacea]
MYDLKGKKGLIVGVANQHSIAFSCAKILDRQGAMLIVSYANEKAAPFVLPLQDSVPDVLFKQCDVSCDEQLANLIAFTQSTFGKIDFLIHSVAFAPLQDLEGRLIDAHREGVQLAMDVSCLSFVRLVRLLEPILNPSSSLITMSYLGSTRAVKNYGLMGPIKAALESSVRYMALELGQQGHRVNAISPGPIKTRAASGLKDFEQLLETSELKSPLNRHLSIEDVAGTALFLVSDLSKAITGGILYVDNGYHAVG